MADFEQAKTKYRATTIRWGFIWALWTAVLWGAWYVPGTAIWYEIPYVNMAFDTNSEFLVAAAVITAFNAVFVLAFLFLWIGVLGKIDDFFRTLKQFSNISKWFFYGAIFGGPMAIFGSFLAMGYVGPVFAAVSALMYPVVGAIMAYFWYNEKITKRAVLGMLLIIAGGIIVYGMGIFEELKSGASGQAWLGYLGGLMAAVGWGVEGAIAGRALDITDPDVGITIRFGAETFYWIVIILPLTALLSPVKVVPIVAQTFNPWALVWLTLAGITFAYCYVSWYKSFPLIGVGRGQAIGDLYGIFAIIFTAVFTLNLPKWNFVIGAILTIIGGFVMYTEKSEVLEVIRAIPRSTEPARCDVDGGV